MARQGPDTGSPGELPDGMGAVATASADSTASLSSGHRGIGLLREGAMCDEFTRESIGRRLGRSITADDVVTVLEEAIRRRGAPSFVHCDNGPDWSLPRSRIGKDWGRFTGIGTVYIEPGSPWHIPFVESFNGKARDELFTREIDSVFEARLLYDDLV